MGGCGGSGRGNFPTSGARAGTRASDGLLGTRRDRSVDTDTRWHSSFWFHAGGADGDYLGVVDVRGLADDTQTKSGYDRAVLRENLNCRWLTKPERAWRGSW